MKSLITRQSIGLPHCVRLPLFAVFRLCIPSIEALLMYTLFYNKECSDCENQAAQTSKLDWFDRINISTGIPPTGELEKGEIVLISKEGKVYSSGYATRKICLNIPVYCLIGLMLFFPPFLRLASKDKAGCNGNTCETNR